MSAWYSLDMLEAALADLGTALARILVPLHERLGSWPLALLGLAALAELARHLLGWLKPGRARTLEVAALRARFRSDMAFHRAHPDVTLPMWHGWVHITWPLGGALLAGLLYAGMAGASRVVLGGVSLLWIDDLAVADPTFGVALAVLALELAASWPGRGRRIHPLRWMVVVALTSLAALLPAGVAVLHLLRAAVRAALFVARVAVAAARHRRAG